jgi:hypothetical protein
MIITLDQSPHVLPTTDAVLDPAVGTVAPPWIVAAVARAIETAPSRSDTHLVALIASGRHHVQGLSTWVAIVGSGASQALGRLRDLTEAANFPVYLEAAHLQEHGFVPFLLREASVTTLLFPQGGGSGLNDWVMAMADDPSDVASLVAATEKIAERFSFRDFVATPGGYSIAPPQQ